MLRRHRKILFLAAAGLAIAVLVGLALRDDREPEYNGHPLHYWLELRAGLAPAVPGHSPLRRSEEAEIAIRHIGTNAIPFLLKWLPYDPPPALKAIERFVWRGGMFPSPFARLPFFRQRTRANAVVDAFISLGADAGCAIPALTQLAEDRTKPVAANRARKCISAILIMADRAEKPGTLAPLLASALTNSSQVVSNLAVDLQVKFRVRFTPLPKPEVSLTLTNVYPPSPLPIGNH